MAESSIIPGQGSVAEKIKNRTRGFNVDKDIINISQLTADNIVDVLREVRTGGPVCGSVNFTNDTRIPNTWYTFLYLPHRDGVGSDNNQYGTLILFPMTDFSNTKGVYVIGYVANAILQVKYLPWTHIVTENISF